jgi:hypothetical protein
MTKKAGKKGGKGAPPTVPAPGRPGDLPGLEAADTKLGKTCQRFRDQVDRIDVEKDELEEIGNEVLKAMKDEKRAFVRFEHKGLKYVFQIQQGKEKLVCKKESAAV